MSKIQIQLVKSLAKKLPLHIETVKSLGLRKRGQSVIQEDNPATRGKISKVSYLLKTQEIK